MTSPSDRIARQRARGSVRSSALRVARARLKRRVRNGEVSVVAALDRVEAQGMPLAVLLGSQRRWGPRRVHRALVVLRAGEDRRVEDLTERQRDVLAGML